MIYHWRSVPERPVLASSGREIGQRTGQVCDAAAFPFGHDTTVPQTAHFKGAAPTGRHPTWRRPCTRSIRLMPSLAIATPHVSAGLAGQAIPGSA